MPHIKGHSGIYWYYEVEGEGEVLLFVHGWGVDRRIWRQQSKFFSQYYRVIAVDLPGHGKSSWKRVTLASMARDLEMILSQLDAGQLTVIGNSLGGLVALKLYELYPQIIKRFVFVGAMPKFSRSEDYPFGLDVTMMRKLSQQVETSYPSIINIFFRSLFTKEERQGRRYKWLQKFRQTDDFPLQKALIEYLDILEEEDLRGILEKIKLPIQYINGTDDEICNRNMVMYLKRLTPHAQFNDFDYCGHFPFLSKPHEFNQVLKNFLSEQE